jgi:hypothetical protein
MKRPLILSLMLLATAVPLTAKEGGVGGAAVGSGGGEASGRNNWGKGRPPVIINMSRGSSGGHNLNFPNERPSRLEGRSPSYGRVHWPPPAQTGPAGEEGAFNPYLRPVVTRARLKTFTDMGIRAANVIHHHPYTPGYVRQKLAVLGVKTEPQFITERSEMIHTDRAHSTVPSPGTGPDGRALTAAPFSGRHFNDKAVRDQMNLLEGNEWRGTIRDLSRTETRAGHYYWHRGEGFDYCHYVDRYGYHWWGWYLGNRYFWLRYFAYRWWWYDEGFGRWAFWNDGFWWWQDPFHVGDLYCYDDMDYIPCNSAEDQIVVTSAENPSLQEFLSPDGTRMVQLDRTTHDAFLYDTAKPPAFDPVYLASGVADVQFSDTANGRPLQIILKLEDGSFDMFDGDGNSYNPGE